MNFRQKTEPTDFLVYFVSRLSILGIFLLLQACDSGSGEAVSASNLLSTSLRDNASISRSEFSSTELTELDKQLSDGVHRSLLNYLDQVARNFSNIATSLNILESETEAFLDQTNFNSMEKLRAAWQAAYDLYELTAFDRHLAAAIIDERSLLSLYQLQYQINHWPVIPGYIDYIEGYADSGVVHDINVIIDPQTLREQNGLFDLSEVLLGYHSIEFLLWGENRDGEGNKRYLDYQQQRISGIIEAEDTLTSDQLANNRRRLLLGVSTGVLIEDFRTLGNLLTQNMESFAAQLNSIPASRLLGILSRAMAEMLEEEILLPSLYPMLNGEFDKSIPSPFSRSSQNAVSNQLSSLERILREGLNSEGVILDEFFIAQSRDFEEFFYQNFDSSKECLVVLYNNVQNQTLATRPLEIEFETVECINLVTNMIDYLRQVSANSSSIP